MTTRIARIGAVKEFARTPFSGGMLSVSRFDLTIAWLGAHPFLVCCFVTALLVLSAVLTRQLGDPATEPQRRINSVALFVLSGLVLAVGTAVFVIEKNWWGYLLALLPGAAIGRHAVYMRLIRRRALAAPVAPPPGLRPPTPDENVLEIKDTGLSLVFARARQMHDLDFAPETLALRFGVPALLTTAIGIGVFDLLKDNAHLGLLASSAREVVRAARFGAAGAMVYVLLYIGQRGFRSDITTGAALWSAIVLAAGPLLAAVLGLAWKGGAQDATWTRDALYFVAGMSPRHAASAVEEAVRRLWLTRASAPQVQSRLQPLGLLRGMTTPIEDRLAEEGIADVQGMAMADPLRLFRSTSFDKRQILSWIDEALLISWLPDLWSSVQKVGITGAIDLMAHVEQREDKIRAVLTNAAKLDPTAVDAVVLAGVVLKEDAQLRLVWALYQFDEDGFEVPSADSTGEALAVPPAPSDPPPVTMTIPALGWLLTGLACVLAAALFDDLQVSVRSLVAPVSVLAIAFAVVVTARWPWSPGIARVIPVASVSLLLVVAFLGRASFTPALTWEWPVRQLFLAAAAACASFFAVGLLADRAACALTVAFPSGTPADAELWVDGRAVPIVPPATGATVCPVPRRRLTLMVRAGNFQQQRWLDARGKRQSTASFALPATVVLQIDPPVAVLQRRLVDGTEVGGGPLMLWPRGVPYSLVVEADGLRGAAAVSVQQAGVIALPIRLQPPPDTRPAAVVVVAAGQQIVTAPNGGGGGPATPPPVPAIQSG